MKYAVTKIITAGVLLAGLSFPDRAASPAAQQAAPKKAEAGKTQAAKVQAEEVSFHNESVKLAGTLVLPQLGAGAKAPAVLIVPTLENSVRDGVLAGKGTHPLYRDLAEHLAARGYVVLRYDHRCGGASGCGPRNTLADYTDDAQAALNYLRGRAEVDPQRLAVFGHGDGSFLGGSVAAHDGKVKTVIVTAASGRSGSKLLTDRAAYRLAQAGTPQAAASEYLAKLDRLINRLINGDFDPAKDKVDLSDKFINHLIQNPDLAFSWLQDDPLQVIIGIQAPVLILQGEKDKEVAVKDAQYLEEAIKRNERPAYELRLLPESDHVFKLTPGAPSLKTYNDTSRPTDAGFYQSVDEWLDKRMK